MAQTIQAGLEPGATLGHYRVVSKLGAGGMGEVYLAQDTRLDRSVALKLLPPSSAGDSEQMARFVFEAKAASALSHPNVAHIYEISETGPLFIAMEFVDGQPLSKMLAGQAMDAQQIVGIAVQVAGALEEAHAKGIVHRDIKPANIMVNLRGQVKILDFGLARRVSKEEDLSGETSADVLKQSLTAVGVVMGTVQYMSPEQALGRKVDARSDLFSLGIVLYEMATGRLPFAGTTSSETITQIIHQQPQPISRLNYNVPPELERIIRKCLEKDVERRYQSARDLLIDLKNFERDSNSGAIPVASGAMAAAKKKKVSRRIDSLAVLPFVNSGGDADTEYLAEGITEGLINCLTQIPKLRVLPRCAMNQVKGKSMSYSQIHNEMGVRALVSGKIVQRGDTLRIQAELIDLATHSQIWGEQYLRKSTDLIELQEEISCDIMGKLRTKISGEDKKRVTRRATNSNEAFELFLKGQFYRNKWTEEGFRKGIEHFQRAIEVDPRYAPAYAGLSACFGPMGFFGYVAPNEAMARAKANALRAIELDDTLADAHVALGMSSLGAEWDWATAERELKRAVELNEQSPIAHQMLGIYYMATQQSSLALMHAQRAVALDPTSPLLQNSLGWAYYFGGRIDDAIAQYRQVIDMDPAFAMAYSDLACCYAVKGRLDEALQVGAMARKLSPTTTMYIAGEAMIQAGLGDTSRARAILDDLIKLSFERYVAPLDIARTCFSLGDLDRGFEWAEKGITGRAGCMIWLLADSSFDPLRGDPRFQSLIERVGFPRVSVAA